MPVRRGRPLVAAGVLGAATLALEVLWLRGVGQALGSGARAAAALCAAFFLAAALGSLLGARTVGARPPLRVAGWWLLAGGLLALAAEALRVPLLTAVGQWPLPEALAHPVAALLLAGAPFAALAAAWPALAAALVGPAGRTAGAGRVQAADLGGAALGAAAAGILLPLWLGLAGAALAVAGLTILVGVWLACDRTPPATTPSVTTVPPAPAWFGWTLAAASGLLVGWGELAALACTRQFGTQAAPAAAAVFAAALLDLALGAALAARWRAAGWAWDGLLRWALAGAAIGAALLPALTALLLRAGLAATGLEPAWQPPLLALAAVVGLAPLLVPAGMVLPLAWEALAPRAAAASALGRAQALNLVFAAVAALLWPLVLPACNLAGLAWGVAGGYLVLLALRAPWRVCAGAASAVALVVLAGWWWGEAPPPGAARVLARNSDPAGEVAVVEDAQGSRHILLDRSYQLNGTGAALTPQRLETWLPLLLTRQPRRVVYIGMASGIGGAAALDLPEVEGLEVAEVVEGVVTAARDHFAAWNAGLWSDPRSRVCVRDGRRLVLGAPPDLDAVVITLIQPAEEGAAALWSRDFLATAATRLRPGGTLCLWLPAFQCDQALLEATVRTFLDVFPCALLLRAGHDPLTPALGLIGSAEPFAVSDAALAERLAVLRARHPAVPDLAGPSRLRLNLIGDLRGIAEQFADAAPITDDRPLPAFRAALPARRGLRLLPLLTWMGTRFVGQPLPSLVTDDSTRLRAELRAGNWLYAEAVWTLPVPDEPPDGAARRAHQAAQARAMIRQLVPGLEADPGSR